MTICAWCNPFKPEETVSYGICPDCSEKMLDDEWHYDLKTGEWEKFEGEEKV